MNLFSIIKYTALCLALTGCYKSNRISQVTCYAGGKIVYKGLARGCIYTDYGNAFTFKEKDSNRQITINAQCMVEDMPSETEK